MDSKRYITPYNFTRSRRNTETRAIRTAAVMTLGTFTKSLAYKLRDKKTQGGRKE